ncbi:hypothetical protein B0H14DRAFT_3535393 [Mycena olivaceomarginata]|nr:hypothetical protein B0H14DRAFT_3535393 [Mycena olivaceomarginata]
MLPPQPPPHPRSRPSHPPVASRDGRHEPFPALSALRHVSSKFPTIPIPLLSMHDCLKPAYIRTLPSLQQAEAQRALKGSYSVVTIFARKYAQTRPGPDGLGRLPVYYRALEDPPDLFNPVPSGPRLAAAHFSLVAISRLLNSVDITVPIDALESLWLRVWPWIQFIEIGHHTPPRDPHDATESALCVSLILFFWSDRRHYAVLHPHVEGVATIFGSASQRIVLATPPHVYDADLDRICGGLAALFSHGEEPISSQLLQDLVDGVGGSRRLALFIASILNRICPRLDVPPTPTNIQNVAKITQFLGATTFTEGASDVWFTQALGRRRPITAMTNALRSLTLTPTSTNAVAGAFGVLLHLLTITPSSGLRRSLRSGLLPAVFACGRRHMATTHQFLLQFFKNVLSPATVFHSVLKISSDALVAADTASINDQPDLLEAWQIIRHLLSFRLNLVDPERSQPCDNKQFRAIVLEPVSAKPGTGNTASFAKCFDSATDILCAKDRIFLRALLIHELTAHGASIAREYRAVASRWSLDRAVPCTVFDYRSGIAQIQVLPLLAIVPGIDNATARTVASSDYRFLVLKHADGRKEHMWVYPVRSP